MAIGGANTPLDDLHQTLVGNARSPFPSKKLSLSRILLSSVFVKLRLHLEKASSQPQQGY